MDDVVYDVRESQITHDTQMADFAIPEHVASANVNEANGGMKYKKSCCPNLHMKSWILSILLWCSIATKLVCFFWRDELCCCDANYCSNSLYAELYANDDWQAICNGEIYDSYAISNVCRSPCNFAMSWYALGLLCGVYFFYLIETICCSSSRRYLSNTGSSDTVYEYVNRLKSYPPSIYWWVECYHWKVTQTTTTTNGVTQTQEHRERVVTHTNHMHYHFGSWCDKSGKLTGLENYKLTKITYHKTLLFANQETSNDYTAKFNKFLRENNFDSCQHHGKNVDIRDFTTKMLTEVEPGAKPCCLNLYSFLLWSLVGLTSCYRLWFAAVVGNKKQFSFVKEINVYSSNPKTMVNRNQQLYQENQFDVV
eukprot:440793_1